MKVTNDLPSGTVHKIPSDFSSKLHMHESALQIWLDITPLARNEWICWIEEAKKQETRRRRIGVGISKLKSGMRRPCCWAGCTHRKKISRKKSVKAL